MDKKFPAVCSNMDLKFAQQRGNCDFNKDKTRIPPLSRMFKKQQKPKRPELEHFASEASTYDLCLSFEISDRYTYILTWFVISDVHIDAYPCSPEISPGFRSGDADKSRYATTLLSCSRIFEPAAVLWMTHC